MNAGNLIFLFLIVGGALAMFSMHRGGHAHGGTASGDGGGGHGGHNHGGSGDAEHVHDAGGAKETQPLLGPPGTQIGEPAPVPAEGEKHRGC